VNAEVRPLSASLTIYWSALLWRVYLIEQVQLYIFVIRNIMIEL